MEDREGTKKKENITQKKQTNEENRKKVGKKKTHLIQKEEI